jgi:hypothetical protein
MIFVETNSFVVVVVVAVVVVHNSYNYYCLEFEEFLKK